MTVQKPEKCCFFINWKVTCYIFAYLLLALQTRTVEYCVTTVQYYFARVIQVDVSPDSEYLAEVILFILFAGAFVIAVAVAVVAYTIVLLVGLYTENWKFLRNYLIFSVMMLVLFIIVSIMAELIMEKERSESVGNSIAIAFNAYFLYVIRSFWLTLDPYPKTNTESV
ncbi:PREDICTED: uncharacterized protein LOC106113897 [Papilio xuthus]|uniref:Uncharacterized protein LOC106113897 n=1 Tax=Papilio xuthus TaxID=66420 RepID=A0AAJ6Z015_PAPXU|nr:PREDICTED: uncharacterized protein LOC106113897 [Papilio xuthus]XP_013162408.1 PREDICTED: uncharacterized protein LOC106113897 [Papilio xuthus]